MYNLGNNSLIDPILLIQFLPISDAVSDILDPTTLWRLISAILWSLYWG